MSELPELFDRAAERFGAVVHGVGSGQWGDATPCTDWDVRALVNHLVYELRWAPPLLAGQTIAEVGTRFDGDLLGDDPSAAWDDAVRAARAAVAAPGALDTTVHLSFGDTPAMGYLTQLTGDLAVHAWDLARGIGADDTLDPELVGYITEAVKPMAAELAASGMFDPPADVPADADEQTRMLALFGRRA
ncbi:MAG: hypothetical protein QOF18_1839 [Frankiaceae bacterium]|nr:hypothetical protein [Frankiaceae bacterium]